MQLEKRTISSYGLLTANSYYFKPETIEQVFDCINYAKENNLKICPYGAGMSFSDVGLLKNHISLDIRSLDKIHSFDANKGIIKAEAGALTTSVLALTMPSGWYLCGLSGSLKNTIAGDISNNINGKDSWKYGNFGNNAVSMKLITANGNIIEVNKNDTPELFNAVIGGMGLLGIIIEVTLQLIKIPSFTVKNTSKKISNIHQLLEEAEMLEPSTSNFFYAWTDAYSKGNNSGRSISETGNFTENNLSYSTNDFLKGLEEKKKIGFLSPSLFWKLFELVESQQSFLIANSLNYWLAKSNSPKEKTAVFPAFQYPLVKYLPDWNLRYRPKGFREFQPVFKRANFINAYEASMNVCRKYKTIPSICAVRKHQKDDFYLSFAENGYSFTIPHDLNKFSSTELERFSNELTAIVLKYEGKIYLGKFPFITAEQCKAMYPDYDAFKKVLNQYNPERIFFSDAAERLFI